MLKKTGRFVCAMLFCSCTAQEHERSQEPTAFAVPQSKEKTEKDKRDKKDERDKRDKRGKKDNKMKGEYLKVQISYDRGVYAVEKIKRKKGAPRKSRGRSAQKGMTFVATQAGIIVDRGMIPDFTKVFVEYMDTDEDKLRREEAEPAVTQRIQLDLPLVSETLELRQPLIRANVNPETAGATDSLYEGELIATLDLKGLK